MSTPIDVLAWFDDYIRRCGAYDDGTPIRDAVAELIEAAQDVKRTEDAYWNMTMTRNPERYAKAHEDARARLYEALARIGSAS